MSSQVPPELPGGARVCYDNRIVRTTQSGLVSEYTVK